MGLYYLAYWQIPNRAVARTLIRGGGGCLFIYSCSKETSRAEHEYMNKHPPINVLATAVIPNVEPLSCYTMPAPVSASAPKLLTPTYSSIELLSTGNILLKRFPTVLLKDTVFSSFFSALPSSRLCFNFIMRL